MYGYKKVLDLERTIREMEAIRPQIDGKILKYNLINRGYGLIGLGLFGACFYIDPVPFGIFFLPLAIEGLSDLATGRHHSISYELFKAHPTYVIDRCRKKMDMLVYKNTLMDDNGSVECN